MEDAEVHPRGIEVSQVTSVVTRGGMIGNHVDRVCADCDRRSEVGTLPARGALAVESRRGKQRAGAAPEAAGVEAGIAGVLVKPDPGDRAIDVRLELQAKLD